MIFTVSTFFRNPKYVIFYVFKLLHTFSRTLLDVIPTFSNFSTVTLSFDPWPWPSKLTVLRWITV